MCRVEEWFAAGETACSLAAGIALHRAQTNKAGLELGEGGRQHREHRSPDRIPRVVEGAVEHQQHIAGLEIGGIALRSATERASRSNEVTTRVSRDGLTSPERTGHEGFIAPRLPRLRAAGITTLATLTAAIVGAPSASAAPVDTVLPVPVAGNTLSFQYATWMGICQDRAIARTHTATPGLTYFRMETGCTGTAHWRNLTTGATGDAEVRASNSPPSPPPVAAATGSGVLVATITLGIPYSTTFWPGMGMWNVPRRARNC